MKQRILLLFVLATALGSCSVYKNGQTPDDVYYSPAREVTGYVSTEDDSRREDATSPDDRYLRMKAINRNRWSQFDDDVAYWNNPTWNNQMYFNSFRTPSYSYYNPWVNSGWSFGIGSGWNNWGYNSWSPFNPFCPAYYGSPVVIVNPKPVNSRQYQPRGTNLDSYSSRGATYYTDPKSGQRVYSVTSGNTSSNSSFRTYRSSGGSYYTPSSGSYRTSSGTPSRSFDNGSSPSYRPSSSGSSSGSSGGSRSSGGSSGGSAPVRSFPRGGGR